MPIRLIAIDLDGTLLNSQSEISNANQEALRAAASRGVKVALVTGRRFHSARPLVASLPCTVTLVTSNGALIASLEGEAMHRDFLPPEVARAVLEATRPHRPYTAALFDIPGRGQIRMETDAAPDGPLAWYQAKSAPFLAFEPDLETALGPDLIQILFGGPPAKIEPIAALLDSSPLRSRLQPTWTKYLERDVCLLDIMNRGCTKGAALERLARRWGIASGEVMAIGDNLNDLEMLQFAGLPVVMGNRTPGLANNQWHVTLSNDEDGVARAIETLALR